MFIHFQYFYCDEKSPLKPSFKFGLLFSYRNPKSHSLLSALKFIVQNLHFYMFWLSVHYVEMPFLKVKKYAKLGTEAIRTQIQPLKPKKYITKITTQNILSTEWAAISQKVASQQPKRTRNNMNTRYLKVKRH